MTPNLPSSPHPAGSLAEAVATLSEEVRLRGHYYFVEAQPKHLGLVLAELSRLQSPPTSEAEIEGLRRDAARYRWLRNPQGMHGISIEQWSPYRTLMSESADEAIDAAIQQQGRNV